MQVCRISRTFVKSLKTYVDMHMRKTIVILSCISVLAAGCGQYRQFTNPVIDRDWPDPTVIYNPEDDHYYSVATGLNRAFMRSADLCEWEDTGIYPFEKETVKTMKDLGPDVWAPQFAKINGRYLIYVTLRSSAEDSRIAVLSSSTVTGPYKFENIVTDSGTTGIKDTIDPFAFVDEETGKTWLVFGSVGGIHQVELTGDGLALAEGAVYKHIAGQDIDRDGSRLTVFEGSYVYKRDGWWYLFASAGRYDDYSYAIVVGRSRNADGPFLNKDGKDMADGYGTTILASSPYDRFYGPGHNGEIFTDRNGDTFIFYHVHTGNYPFERTLASHNMRFTNLQRIYWDKDGWPYFRREEIAGGKIQTKTKGI